MTLITNIQPTTELDAVNTMLTVIGESPLPSGTDLSTITQADVVTAIELLRDATRGVQTLPWRYNFERGVEVAPTATFAWTDSANVTTTLNIFKKPAGVLSWKQTVCSENRSLDLVERPSKKYKESSKAVLVLYDRTMNRDGADAGLFPYVYLDTISAFDFEQMPESVRAFVTVHAARQLAERVVNSETISGFTARDEQMLYRTLVRDQGLETDYSILSTFGARAALGFRPMQDQRAALTVYRQ